MTFTMSENYEVNRYKLKIEKCKATRICWFCNEIIEKGTDCVKNVISSIHVDCWLQRQIEIFGKEFWNDDKIQDRLLEALSRRV